MNQKEQRMLIIGTLIFAVTMAALIYVVFRRDISTMESVYIINEGMDFVGLFIGYLLFVSSMADEHRTITDRRRFLLLLISASAGLVLDILAWVVDGIPELRAANVAVNTLYYICAPMQAYLFWNYLKTFIHIGRPSALFMDKIIRKGIWAAIGIRILNIFTGIYFVVDQNGVYHRSSTYIISMIYVNVTLMSCLMIINQEHKQLRRSQLIVLISYVMVPIFASILTAKMYGLSTGPVILMGEVLLMYCVLNVEQGREQAIADRDLKMATRIQANMLPNIFPPFSERSDFDIYASMTPAKEVGGDFYDFFLIDDDHLGMVIADVSGKGVPAALFMMASMILVNNTARMEGAGASPGAVLTMVNDAICSNNSEEMFVTVWLGILTISTGRVVAANAGHEYPFLRGSDGSFKLLKDPHGLVIGAMEEMRYTDYEFTLEKGGTLFVYTDGVTEATNTELELFGTVRTLEALNEAKDKPLKELLDHVKGNVDRFKGEAPQFDDLTMMAVTRF